MRHKKMLVQLHLFLFKLPKLHSLSFRAQPCGVIQNLKSGEK